MPTSLLIRDSTRSPRLVVVPSTSPSRTPDSGVRKGTKVLEQAIAEAKRDGGKADEIASAEELLSEIADSIIDNWTAYTSGGEEFSADGFDTVPDGRVESLGSFNAVRRAVADAIVALTG